MKVNLLPIQLKKFMKTLRNVGLGFAIMCSLIAIFGVLVSNDLTTRIAIIAVAGVLIIISNFQNFRFLNVSQLEAHFESTEIIIVDRRGKIIRTISYTDIKSFKTTQIQGFFFGKDNENLKIEYLCLFLKEDEIIPDVPYKKLFNHKDFVIMEPSLEVEMFLEDKLSK